MNLDDDIARVARARGRDPANYQRRRETSMESAARRLGQQTVRNAFYLPQDPNTELLVYDALPKASRVFIRESIVAISAIKWSEMLETVEGDQSALIELFAEVIPLRVQDVVRRRYGPSHPQAGV